MDHQNPPQVLVHLYRACVQHADVWRTRLDTTTNWAVITTAAVITFAFGSPATPHFVVLLALLFDLFFLFMESRRYQAYNLWQRRMRQLHRALIAPALMAPEMVDEGETKKLLIELGEDLGHWVPALSIWGAVGYRLRRNYGPLVTLILLIWMLKLYIHPVTATGWLGYMDGARVGLVPGWIVLSAGALFFAACVFLALRAPTERMKSWRDLPAPIEHVMHPIATAAGVRDDELDREPDA